MVDKNSENEPKIPQYPSHIGWTIAKISRLWSQQFVQKTNALGHNWFTLSASNLLGHLPRKGLNQKALTTRTGLTKQAVNQQIDDLVKANILKRTVSQTDKRARIISYTDKGLAALKDIDKIKLEIEQDYIKIIGQDALDQLIKTVDKLTE
ncbi:MAG: MarR family transcriptional regulator [Alphaproteobacteria bacterium]|nr:MarR family transcriptional regulator [Alphaproteobacteria bacterium]